MVKRAGDWLFLWSPEHAGGEEEVLGEPGGERRDLFACSCYTTRQVINQGEVLVL